MQPSDKVPCEGSEDEAAVVKDLVMPARWSVPDVWLPNPKLTEIRELCEACRLFLDDWQWFILGRALGLQPDGKFAAFEVGVCVGRQNGKGGILEARELAGLFVLGERMVIHSAHQFDTSMEAFLRMEILLEEGGLLGELKPRSGISRSHGSEGFHLRNGNRLRYRTRTKGGGRGFTGDTVMFDEAMVLPEMFLSAVLPVMSARSMDGNPQAWYMGSAVDQNVHEDGVVFARVRDRGLRRADSLAWFEWSATDDPKMAAGQAGELLDDVDAWHRANPALDVRISEDYVRKERASLDDRGFAVERLGIGDWPPVDAFGGGIIKLEDWLALSDSSSQPTGEICLAFDVSPNRSSASIGVAGHRPDDRFHLEVIDHRSGTGWVIPRIKELVERHRPAMVICDGPARALSAALVSEGVEIHETTGPEYAEACAQLVDAVMDDKLRHLGTQEMLAAIRGAETKPLGDGWKWSRRASSSDITPLVAVTLAMWGASKFSASGDVLFDWSKVAA